MTKSTFIAVVCSVWLACALQAQQRGSEEGSRGSATLVPRLVNFAGNVKDAAGKPQTGTIAVTFALYEEQEGGSPLWPEIQNVTLDDHGHYSILLGSTRPEGLPLDAFIGGKARWLGVQPELAGVAEQPRIMLVGVPYALKAADADTLGGVPASAFMRMPIASGARLTPSTLGVTAGRHELGKPAIACSSVTSDGTASANQITMFTAPCNVEPSAIFQSGGNIGIGTLTPQYTLDVKGAARINNMVINGTGGGYDYMSLPNNYYLVGAGNDIGGFGYNWFFRYNGGQPQYYKPVADTSIWWELSNASAAFSLASISWSVGPLRSYKLQRQTTPMSDPCPWPLGPATSALERRRRRPNWR